jgi:hypothetical protein
MTDAITKDLMDWGVHADVFPAFELPAKYSRHDISSLNEWARQAATYLRAAVDHIEDQEPPPASAIEAHSAETEGLGPKAESAVGREPETPVPLPADAITKAVEALKQSRDGWNNAIEMGIIPPQHHMSARIMRDNCAAALTALQEQPSPAREEEQMECQEENHGRCWYCEHGRECVARGEKP